MKSATISGPTPCARSSDDEGERERAELELVQRWHARAAEAHERQRQRRERGEPEQPAQRPGRHRQLDAFTAGNTFVAISSRLGQASFGGMPPASGWSISIPFFFSCCAACSGVKMR